MGSQIRLDPCRLLGDTVLYSKVESGKSRRRGSGKLLGTLIIALLLLTMVGATTGSTS